MGIITRAHWVNGRVLVYLSLGLCKYNIFQNSDSYIVISGATNCLPPHLIPGDLGPPEKMFLSTESLSCFMDIEIFIPHDTIIASGRCSLALLTLSLFRPDQIVLWTLTYPFFVQS